MQFPSSKHHFQNTFEAHKCITLQILYFLPFLNNKDTFYEIETIHTHTPSTLVPRTRFMHL